MILMPTPTQFGSRVGNPARRASYTTKGERQPAMNHDTISAILQENHPIVYVAGPYRAPTEYEVSRNIERAREAGVSLATAGTGFHIPHLNSKHMGGVVPDDQWLRFGLNMIKRLDGMVLLPGWRTSEGACIERAAAQLLGLPVFASVSDCIQNQSQMLRPI